MNSFLYLTVLFAVASANTKPATWSSQYGTGSYHDVVSHGPTVYSTAVPAAPQVSTVSKLACPPGWGCAEDDAKPAAFSAISAPVHKAVSSSAQYSSTPSKLACPPGWGCVDDLTPATYSAIYGQSSVSNNANHAVAAPQVPTVSSFSSFAAPVHKVVSSPVKFSSTTSKLACPPGWGCFEEEVKPATYSAIYGQPIYTTNAHNAVASAWSSAPQVLSAPVQYWSTTSKLACPPGWGCADDDVKPATFSAISAPVHKVVSSSAQYSSTPAKFACPPGWGCVDDITPATYRAIYGQPIYTTIANSAPWSSAYPVAWTESAFQKRSGQNARNPSPPTNA